MIFSVEATALLFLQLQEYVTLQVWCRHIDTARYYRNEADVGKALKNSGVPREDVFLTTKLWLSDFGYSNSRKVLAGIHPVGVLAMLVPIPV